MLTADRLAAARMRTMSQLARPTAHDVRGAVSTIAVHTALLADALVAADPALRERQRRWVGAIDEARERLVGLIDRLVGTLHEPSDAPSDVDLRDVAARAATLLAPLATGRRVACAAAVPDAPVPVRASHDVVLQIVLDLALAAIEACEPGRDVTIAAVGAAVPRLEVVVPSVPTLHARASAVLSAWGNALEATDGLRVRSSRDAEPPALLVEFPSASTE